MVQITEFRVVMPLSVEEYRVAQMYMVTKIQEQQTAGSEGVEVIRNEPFVNEEFGMGQYTYKKYHMQSKAPSWLTAFAPTNSLLIEEEAWNAYPKCKTVLKCPYFARFKLTIETLHVADNGNSHNVHNLSVDTLRNRKVDFVDITSTTRDYWSYVIGGVTVDLTTFQSQKTKRGLLTPGWQDRVKPVMTAYKLVTVDAPYWGFGYRLEQLVLGGERALFLESHKQCVSWMDEWYGLTLEDVRKLELLTDEALNKSLLSQGSASKEDFLKGGSKSIIVSRATLDPGNKGSRENSVLNRDGRELQMDHQSVYTQSNDPLEETHSDSCLRVESLASTVAVMI